MIFRSLFFLATVFALSIAAWSLLAEPPPLPLATLALVGYVALLWFALVARRDVFADGWVDGPAGTSGLLLLLDDDAALLEAAKKQAIPATVLVSSAATDTHLRALHDAGFSLAVQFGPRDRLGLFTAPGTLKRHLTPILARAEAAGIPLEAAFPVLATPATGRVLAALGLIALLPRAPFEVQQHARFEKRLMRVVKDRCILHLRVPPIAPSASSRSAIALVVEAAQRKQLAFAKLETWLAKA